MTCKMGFSSFTRRIADSDILSFFSRYAIILADRFVSVAFIMMLDTKLNIATRCSWSSGSEEDDLSVAGYRQHFPKCRGK
jgi:hypothetical protein